MDYKPTIGLEVHIELNTRSKMFCSCPNDSNEKHPNINICPVCLGHPGTLPVINEEAVKKVIKTGLALSCQIPEYSKFDRKNYFYPDLPKGYQISQYDEPLCKNGRISEIRIQRIHLEEDTGRLIHDGSHSLVDFNRAGIPLMELVTQPDLRSAKEARQFAEELQLILRYLGVSNADMEKGELRVEANISLSKDITKLGTKAEIKNLNSFRAVEKALDYEIERQKKILKSGKKVIQETRGWDMQKEITVSQRTKEEAHDYRYFPEPDLPPMHFTGEAVEKIRAEIPELPNAREERFKNEYGIADEAVGIFVQNKDLGEYFEKAMSELVQWATEVGMKRTVKEDEFLKLAKLCSNYITTDLQGLLKGAEARPPKFSGKILEGKDFLITPENFAEFIILIDKGEISSKIAKLVLSEMFSTGADPSHIIKEKQLVQIIDETEIEKIIEEVISKNKKAVEDYNKGKSNAFQYLIGQVMAQTKGKASPGVVNKMLKQNLTKFK